MYNNRENSEICRRCNLNEVEAEPIDYLFKLNCNDCATDRTEKARAMWITRSESALHSCYNCLTSFRLKQSQPHQCTREDVFPCGECGRHLYSAADLRNHTRYLHKKAANVENEQYEMFGINVVDLGEKNGSSRKVEPDSKTKQCEICSKRFARTSQLNSHLRTHTGEKPFQCKICGKTFSKDSTLKIHGVVHTGEKPYHCKHCQKTFSLNDTLIKHLRTHTGEKPYKCEICGRTFAQSCTLRKHLRTHTGHKPFQCKICGKKYSDSYYLKKHLVTHTEGKVHSCKHCQKTFSKSCTLIKQLGTDTGENPNQYKSEEFSESGILNNHSVAPTGVGASHQCEICGKKLSQSGALKAHLQIHTGHKPFQCEICGKGFFQHVHLNRHLQTHTNEKPYCCDICGKKFSHPDYLKTHYLFHTEEKPDKCVGKNVVSQVT